MTSPAITRAMVMAAGLGTRMRPLTNDRPKPMIEVRGKALADYMLDRLANVGVQEVVVNVHYLADMMEGHVTGRSAPKVTISDERDGLLDTGGGFAKAARHFGDEPVFYVNTDAIVVDGAQDAFARMVAAWRDDEMDGLLLLVPKEATSGYDGLGDFHLAADGRIEKRKSKDEPADYVWTGVQILHTRLLEGAPEGAFSTWELWSKALDAGRLCGLAHDGLWMHVGSPDGLKEAERRLDAIETHRY